MKKTMLFLFLSLVMVGCKKENEGQEKVKEENIESKSQCKTLAGYDTISDISEKAEWLRNNGKDVCVYTLYKKVLNHHTIEKIEDFTINQNSSFKKTWKEIDSITNAYSAYERYLSFDLDMTNPTDPKIKDIKTVLEFSETTPCYSLPLLRAIAEENDLDTTFEFLNATKVGGKGIMIIIKTTKTTTDHEGVITTVNTYYDYSDEPKLHDGSGLVIVEKPL